MWKENEKRKVKPCLENTAQFDENTFEIRLRMIPKNDFCAKSTQAFKKREATTFILHFFSDGVKGQKRGEKIKRKENLPSMS